MRSQVVIFSAEISHTVVLLSPAVLYCIADLNAAVCYCGPDETFLRANVFPLSRDKLAEHESKMARSTSLERTRFNDSTKQGKTNLHTH
jgi:hypothetical protein